MLLAPCRPARFTELRVRPSWGRCAQGGAADARPQTYGLRSAWNNSWREISRAFRACPQGPLCLPAPSGCGARWFCTGTQVPGGSGLGAWPLLQRFSHLENGHHLTGGGSGKPPHTRAWACRLGEYQLFLLVTVPLSSPSRLTLRIAKTRCHLGGAVEVDTTTSSSTTRTYVSHRWAGRDGGDKG